MSARKILATDPEAGNTGGGKTQWKQSNRIIGIIYQISDSMTQLQEWGTMMVHSKSGFHEPLEKYIQLCVLTETNKIYTEI